MPAKYLKTSTPVPSMFQGLLNIKGIGVQHRVSSEPFNLLLWDFHRLMLIYKLYFELTFGGHFGSHIENKKNAYTGLFLYKIVEQYIYTKNLTSWLILIYCSIWNKTKKNVFRGFNAPYFEGYSKIIGMHNLKIMPSLIAWYPVRLIRILKAIIFPFKTPTLLQLLHLIYKGLVRDIWSFCCICWTCCLMSSPSLDLGVGDILSKSHVPDLFETKILSSLSFLIIHHLYLNQNR